MPRRRKGKLEEVLSKAMYGDDPSLYTIIYRDFMGRAEASLLDFLEISEGFARIPASRILEVRRDGVTVFAREGARTQ